MRCGNADFWEHTIRDDRDFEAHIDYIHFNPVKHGLVRRVRDWPHSSFHRYVRQGLLPEDWAGDVSEAGGGYARLASSNLDTLLSKMDATMSKSDDGENHVEVRILEQ